MVRKDSLEFLLKLQRTDTDRVDALSATKPSSRTELNLLPVTPKKKPLNQLKKA